MAPCGARRCRRAAVASVIVAVVAAALTPAAASVVDMANPLALSWSNATELAALQLALGASVEIGAALATGRTPLPLATSSSAPPGVTPTMLASAVGKVLAAASLDSEAQSTLGDPKPWPMGDGDRNALYRLPVKGIRLIGTCVFIHGCYHDPESWFYQSRKCPTCTGLPEEVAHTKACLARGYAVLALASKDRTRQRCFSSSGNPALSDQQDVKAAIQSWTSHFGLTHRPIYMWGVSAGAAFAIKFPMTMWVDGVVSEVNMPWEKAWGATNGHGKLLFRYPPVAYYAMQRDLETLRQIQLAVQILNNNGVNSQYVYVPSNPVYPSMFSRRSIYISRQQSAAIVAGLKRIGAIDKQGWLNYDPRLNLKWLTQLPKVLPWLGNTRDPRNPFNLITDGSQITEEMNRAWAWHEIVGDYVRPTLVWLERRGAANLTALCDQYSLYGNLACLTERREGCTGITPSPPPPPPPPRPLVHRPRPPPPRRHKPRPPPPSPKVHKPRPPPPSPRPPRSPRAPPPSPRPPRPPPSEISG